VKGIKQMKYKIFDVVRLKNKNRATILNVIDKKRYFAEIVNEFGKTIDKKEISENEIDRQII
jgi:hypothetical protein